MKGESQNEGGGDDGVPSTAKQGGEHGGILSERKLGGWALL
jgi:hypothetical protein